MRIPPALALTAFAAVAPWQRSAAGPMRAEIPFEYTGNVGFGNEVFVHAEHPDFQAGGRLPKGVKLAWHPGNVWRGTVAVESGATVSYRFYRHPGDPSGFCQGSPVALTAPASLAVPPPPPAPCAAKIVRYVSGWTEAILVYRNRTSGGAWTERPMERIGVGRTPGESAFEARLEAGSADEIEFVFRNASNAYDNAPPPPESAPQGAAPARPVPYQGLVPPYNYRTRFPAFVVQGGEVFNYRPPANPSLPRIETRAVASTVPGVPGRTIRILLPRGYDNNPWKRYPVVYFHDGQNVFFPGGAFGTWDADRIARYETGQGRMREAILVAVDNADAYGSTRRTEYVPPGDSVGGLPGTADAYARFLLENVLPTLDHHYRTLTPPGGPNRPEETIIAGSSLGGVASAYIAREHRDRFGRAGVFSPAWWAARGYLDAAFLPDPKLPIQFYMDIGSAESSGGESSSAVYWNDALRVANNLVSDGYAFNRDLLFLPECGGLHNEAAWSRRLPAFFDFALNPWSDPQWLAAELSPPSPRITAIHPGPGSATLEIAAPLGIPILIQSGTALAPSNSWAAWAEIPVGTGVAWRTETRTGPLPHTGRSFWRSRVSLPDY